MKDTVRRTVPRELHDRVYQQQLRRIATDLAANLSARASTAAVLLVGSVARGPVTRSSDVDILVVGHVRRHDMPAEDWSFDPGGIAINARRMDVQTLLKISEADDEEFAEFCVTTWLPDHLDGHEKLVVSEDCRTLLTESIKTIVDRRHDPANVAAMCSLLRKRAVGHVDRATAHLERDQPGDAHAALRMVGRLLLEEELVARAEIVRGSKKRPELLLRAVGCETHPVVDFVGMISGFADRGPAHAATLASLRLKHRQRARQVIADVANAFNTPSLRRLENVWAAHSRYANDYYAPLIAGGFWRGVVNHIRCHSGVPKLPNQLMEAMNISTATPVTAFLACDVLSQSFRSEWRRLSGTDTDGLHVEAWLDAARDLNRRPSRTHAPGP